MSLPKMYKSCLLCAEYGSECNKKLGNELEDRWRNNRDKFYLEATSAAHHVAYNEGFSAEEKHVAKESLDWCNYLCDFTNALMARKVKNKVEEDGFIFSEDDRDMLGDLGIGPDKPKLYGSDDL